MLESLIVLETISSSLRKNQNISLCSIFAVSGGYFARLICAWTALYHSSTLISPCLKLVKRLNLGSLFEACTILQICSIPLPSIFHLGASTMAHIGRCQNHLTRPQHFYIFLLQIALPVHNPMFSYLIFHFRNPRYKFSFTVQSILVLLCRVYTFAA